MRRVWPRLDASQRRHPAVTHLEVLRARPLKTCVGAFAVARLLALRFHGGPLLLQPITNRKLNLRRHWDAFLGSDLSQGIEKALL